MIRRSGAELVRVDYEERVIGVGDAVKPTEITMKLLGTDKIPLFEKEIHLWAYPVESIFAEKLETAIARADQNSRMKDYHDQ